MIDVRVSAHDCEYLQLVALEDFDDALDFVAGVHDDCFARFGIAENRAVALQHADGNYFVN